MVKKIPHLALAAVFLLLLGFISTGECLACSTFALTNDNSYLIGHNLGGSESLMKVPGTVFVNTRGVKKGSATFTELFEGEAASLPKLKWTSKYGSVTYNPFGRDFPDGGLNEMGLYVGEMSASKDHQYPENAGKPKFFTHLWIQYLLDSFATVDEVLSSLSDVSLDQSFSEWHFFVADTEGNEAIVEFIKGETIVYSNDEMPVKVLCNTHYADSLDFLRTFKGYGGDREIDFSDKTYDPVSRIRYRFVHAAKMLDDNRRNPAESDVHYAFDILEQMNFGCTLWSIVYDMKNMKMYYRTNQSTNVKHFGFSAFDFTCEGPVMMLDIHEDLSGDVTEKFKPYSKEANRSQIERLFKTIWSGKPGVSETIDRFADYPETESTEER